MMCLLFPGSPFSAAAIVFYTCICIPFHGLKRVLLGRLTHPQEPEGGKDLAINGDSELTTYLPAVALSENEEGVCSICLVELEEEDGGGNVVVTKLPRCDHLFHFNCIETWLVLHGRFTCPLCRSFVFSNDGLCPSDRSKSSSSSAFSSPAVFTLAIPASFLILLSFPHFFC
ncbi:PREDICTED: RING-H2 finger protein ATL18-like [Tarenaya hassleriana]|uniref:RING-H2 finger protein ATL18-like n=1 Tax=Tarenaya hassleriana TaxID=28532 RepID=UPI00053C3C59|nr:PREDICTED: RING-H2 finger protein ATL18-like [Tarenaya hassleriana]